MERKRAIEVGIAIFIILALVGVIWWMFLRQKPQTSVVSQDTPQHLPQRTTPSVSTPETAVDAPQAQEVSATTVARTFAERMGSYSSESNFQNVEDVLGVVTESLASQLKKDAARERAAMPSETGGYYGISTLYLGAKTTEQSDTSIALLVQTQREESFGSPGNSSIRYQSLELTLVKEGESWKVNTYTWQD